MIHLKYAPALWLALPLLLFLFLSGVTPPEFETIRYSITHGSSLNINGKTNINRFACCSEQTFQNLELLYQIDEQTQTYQFASQLRLNVSEFICEKKMMTRDLRDALQADQYPYITIALHEAWPTGKPARTTDGVVVDFMTLADISMAGTCRAMRIPIRVFKNDDLRMRFYGVLKIKLTDFNIEPPTALAGLIEVKDEMEITFDLDVVFSPET